MWSSTYRYQNLVCKRHKNTNTHKTISSSLKKCRLRMCTSDVWSSEVHWQSRNYGESWGSCFLNLLCKELSPRGRRNPAVLQQTVEKVQRKFVHDGSTLFPSTGCPPVMDATPCSKFLISPESKWLKLIIELLRDAMTRRTNRAPVVMDHSKSSSCCQT